MPKKLTKLKIHEVSAVDSGAGRGVRIMLAKRATGFDEAGELLVDGVPRWRRKTVAGDGDSLAKALKEIELNNRTLAISPTAPSMEVPVETDVIKAMGARLAEIRKADPTIRSDNHALLKLSESRNPADFELFQSYKNGVALPSSVEKSVKVKKTLKTMSARCDEIMVSDPTCRSRESAIAKVATSRLESDRQLWADYRLASQQAPDGALPRSEPAPVGKAADEIEFSRLCRALAEMYPGYSDAKVRAWARQIVETAPAPPPTRTTYIAPPNS